MRDHLDNSLQQPRLTTAILAGFAVAALLLEWRGGARKPSCAGHIWQVAVTLVLGLAGGIGLPLTGGSLLRSMLFAVSAFDPLTLSAVSALLLASAVLAMLVPAVRAATLDPVRAMREE